MMKNVFLLVEFGMLVKDHYLQKTDQIYLRLLFY